MKKVWRYWAKAIGPKEFEDDKQSDIVAIIRTLWIIIHLVTCYAITSNAINNHGLALIGL